MIMALNNYKAMLILSTTLLTLTVCIILVGLDRIGFIFAYTLTLLYGLHLNHYFNYKFDISNLKEYTPKFFKTTIFIFIPFLFFTYCFEIINQNMPGVTTILIYYLLFFVSLSLLAAVGTIIWPENRAIKDLLEGIVTGLITQITLAYILIFTVIGLFKNLNLNYFLLNDYTVLIKAILALPICYLLSILFNFFYSLIRNNQKIKVIILGAGNTAAELVPILESLPSYLIDLQGCISQTDKKISIPEKYYIQQQVEIEELAIKNQVDLIILSEDYELSLQNNYILHAEVIEPIAVYEEIEGRIPLKYADLTWLSNNVKTSQRLIYNIHKRIMDIITAIIILIVTSPVLVILYVQIKMIDKGAFLFPNKRMGIDGKEFDAYKVRTMIENAQDKLFVIHSGEGGDPRWLPGASIVRASRLDEIPQMINVLQGTMSIVGPRPDQKILQNELEALHPLQKIRRIIKSGWTGWAQISAGHFETLESAIQKVDYDLYYLKHQGLFFDILIFFRALILIFTASHK